MVGNESFLFRLDIIWNVLSYRCDGYSLRDNLHGLKPFKHSDEALRHHCQQGPFPFILNSYVKSFHPRCDILVHCSLDENITGGTVAFFEHLNGSDHHRILALDLPELSALRHEYRRTILLKNLESLIRLWQSPSLRPLHLVILEAVQLRERWDYCSFLPDFEWITDETVLLIQPKCRPPFLWGLYPHLLENSASRVRLPGRIQTLESLSLWCIRKVQPFDLLKLLINRLKHPIAT